MATTSSSLGRSHQGALGGGVKNRPKRKKVVTRVKRERGKLIDKAIMTGPGQLYRPSFAKAAKILCSVYGSTAAELAEFFHVEPATIYLWIKTRSDFRQAVENGATSANMMVMQRLYRQAIGFTYMGEKVFYDGRRGKVIRTTIKEYVQPSETAQIFWLKNRMPDKWRDKHELSGPDGKKLAGDLYQLFNVTVSPDAAIDTYNKLLQVEARADVEFKKQKD